MVNSVVVAIVVVGLDVDVRSVVNPYGASVVGFFTISSLGFGGNLLWKADIIPLYNQLPLFDLSLASVQFLCFTMQQFAQPGVHVKELHPCKLSL